MVASTLSLTERFAPPNQPFVDGRLQLVRLTRKDAEAMMKLGIIPEDASTELLNGWVVLKDRSALGQDPTMIGTNHTLCVELLSDLRFRINNSSRHVRSQQPLVCSETHVPEPDFMVLRRTVRDYADIPTAADSYCVVEVADSSYERDTGLKLIGYAKAGVAQYVVINLRNRTAEVYTQPDPVAGTYAQPTIVAPGQTLRLRVGDSEYFEIGLDEIVAR
jgi:Uma2 family endonuclease